MDDALEVMILVERLWRKPVREEHLNVGMANDTGATGHVASALKSGPKENPFYSDENMKTLEERFKKYKAGSGVSHHDLMEEEQ